MNIDIINYNLSDYSDTEDALSKIPIELESTINKTFQTAIIYVEQPLLTLVETFKEQVWLERFDFLNANFVLVLYKDPILMNNMPFKYVSIKNNIVVTKQTELIMKNNFIVIENISIEQLLKYFIDIDDKLGLFQLLIERGLYEDSMDYSNIFTNMPIYNAHNFINTSNNEFNLTDIIMLNKNSMNRLLLKTILKNIRAVRQKFLLDFFNK